jgi:hypothetical protein
VIKKTSELKDLDVDRVDGVDKPATGRSFLLFKGADGDQVMKGYGMVATAAGAVLSKMRTDKNAVVSRKSAVALNGLAQVLGQDPVFVGKSVPTQPYEFSEPDADKRGPADEDLGQNFTPRAMPGSMVGSVQFRMKDEDMEMEDEEEDKPWEKNARSVAAAKAQALKDADEAMDATEVANRGVARSIEAMAKGIEQLTKAIGELPGAIVKAERAEIAKMEGGEPEGEEAEPVRKSAKSRQIVDDEPVSVRKGAGGYEPKMGVSFGNVVFGGKR